jgi:hypothetical protein
MNQWSGMATCSSASRRLASIRAFGTCCSIGWRTGRLYRRPVVQTPSLRRVLNSEIHGAY